MRYFFDTEFIEDGRTIDLISIGIVDETGRGYYAASGDADLRKASPWVRQNVLPQLPPYAYPLWKPRVQIRDDVLTFVTGEPEFWAYYAAYDWVALCQLFGTMMDLPKGWPKYCRDLKQLSVSVGSPQHPPQLSGVHDALADARWNRELYEFLTRPK